MRYVHFVLACLFVSVSVSAAEIDDIDGLRAAINTHNNALLSGDRTQVSKTVLFPHVQFYPDGRVDVTQQESDLPDRGDDQPQWRISDTTLVSHEKELAIVRVSFERVGDMAETAAGAGLWCFALGESGWLIYWRHYLGADANQ